MIRRLLIELGEDPSREGLARTPERVRRSLTELTAGHDKTVEDVVGQGVFEEDCSEMVLVKDIEFYSLCEHHMLPFYGQACTWATSRTGASSGSPRSRASSTSSRVACRCRSGLTVQIAEALQEALEPKGVGVVADAAPPVHDDARRAEAELVDDDLLLARLLPRGRPHAQ